MSKFNDRLTTCAGDCQQKNELLFMIKQEDVVQTGDTLLTKRLLFDFKSQTVLIAINITAGCMRKELHAKNR